MNLKQILCLAGAGIVATQTLLASREVRGATMADSEIIASENSSPTSDIPSSDGGRGGSRSSRRQATGRSRRQDVRYRFECNLANQTVLALYKGRRSRGSDRIRWKRFGDRKLVQWTDEGAREFGEQYTAQGRCRAVTTRFNQYFLRQAGQPKIPPLSEGTVSGQPVICAAPEGACSSNNILWTLKQDNQGSNGRIVVQLQRALRGDAGSAPIFESDDDLDVSEEEAATSIDMETLIEGIIAQETEELDAPEDLPEDQLEFDEVDLED